MDRIQFGTAGYETRSSLSVTPSAPAPAPVSESNLPPAKRAHRDRTITPARVPALLAVLYLYVVSRLIDRPVTQTDIGIWRASTIEALRQLPEGRVPTDEELMSSINEFMDAVMAEKWLELGWLDDAPRDIWTVTRDWRIVGDAEVDEGQDGSERNVGGGDGGEAEEPMTPSRKKAAKTPLRRKEKRAWKDDGWESAAGLKAGLGTMFQDAFDWLSDDRRADYKEWEKSVRDRIERLEKEGDVVHEEDVMVA
ncbi:hypothetical protein H2203_000733 [Taxawa tesnikishii (nom. ined.)]|nr:hypothetical protein H2203_000733 [Dothideales sp. JES 119]